MRFSGSRVLSNLHNNNKFHFTCPLESFPPFVGHAIFTDSDKHLAEKLFWHLCKVAIEVVATNTNVKSLLSSHILVLSLACPYAVAAGDGNGGHIVAQFGIAHVPMRSRWL